jgi:glycine/serine hydroxymethyltransferase
MGRNEVRIIVDMMDRAMVNAEEENALNRIARQVRGLCRQFPVYSQTLDS